MRVAAVEKYYTLQSSLIVFVFPLVRISSFYLYDDEIFFAVKKNFIDFYFLTAITGQLSCDLSVRYI